jgi:hypothetical protein
MRARRSGVILCGPPLGFTLVVRNTEACACAEPNGAKTMRGVAERYSDVPNASKIIF